MVGLKPFYFVIHPHLLIVISPNGQHKRNLYICMGSSASKEQSAADMKGTEKSAISQPLTYNICCNTSNYIKAVVTHPFHTTTRLMKKLTWHQICPSHWDIYSPTVVLLQCLILSLFLGIPSTQVSMIHWHEVTYPPKNLATVTSRFALPLLLLPNEVFHWSSINV